MNQNFSSQKVARLSVSEAAKYLGVSIASIRRWTDNGSLAHSRTPGNMRRFSIEELDRFAEESKR